VEEGREGEKGKDRNIKIIIFLKKAEMLRVRCE